jgi:hypothetical protein
MNPRPPTQSAGNGRNLLKEIKVSASTFSVSSDVTYLGVAEGTNIWEGLQPNSTAYLLEGPDFRFTVTEVPEP